MRRHYAIRDDYEKRLQLNTQRQQQVLGAVWPSYVPKTERGIAAHRAAQWLAGDRLGVLTLLYRNQPATSRDNLSSRPSNVE